MAKEISWDDAIQQVLAKAEGAVHYSDIADSIVSQGLRQSVGATPASTVASFLSQSINKSNESPYLRVGRGEYTLKSLVERKQENPQPSTATDEQTLEAGALRAFGMFWARAEVYWNGTPRTLGRQGTAATEVNFANQVGIYLLHDRERVIYVGRASDTLFSRLKAHTMDRLGSRWDRFS